MSIAISLVSWHLKLIAHCHYKPLMWYHRVEIESVCSALLMLLEIAFLSMFL